MISDNWEDVFAVFDAALSTSGVARDEFLERKCGGNARLRDKVESLLAAHRDAEGFLSGGQVRATRASGGPSSSVSRILAPGTRIGVFEIESFAGAGGMGEVYRARDTRLDRHVALKILSPDATTDIRRRARLAYEARAIARLSHPHICALHDIGHHDGVDFLVMEYLDGETLASRLRRAPLPVAEAVRIAIQIADALDAAHAEGIVHSDLKPANIMLVNDSSGRDGEPESKLLDFGLARFQPTPRISESGMPAADHAGSTRRGAIAGTPQYMAPEQVRGEEADPRSDIFSFGCVLCEMVSGRAAFAGGTAEDVMSAILSADPSGLPIDRSRSGGATANASRRLERVIRRCLEKEPDRRFNGMPDVKIELHAVARAVAETKLRRSRRWAAVAAVALVAIGVAVWPRLRSLPGPVPLPAAMKVVQLTSLNGLEVAPTFSPDGAQVAFSWNGEREDNYDIYVKTVGSSDVRRLTTDPAADTLPIWSPDGKQIAFLRDHPRRRYHRALRPPHWSRGAEAVGLPHRRRCIGAHRVVAGWTLDRRQTRPDRGRGEERQLGPVPDPARERYASSAHGGKGARHGRCPGVLSRRAALRVCRMRELEQSRLRRECHRFTRGLHSGGTAAAPRERGPVGHGGRMESRWHVHRVRHERTRTLGALARVARWRRRA